MGLWRVFYAGWQMEWRGTPFPAGDAGRPLLVPGEEPASTVTGPAGHATGAGRGTRVVRDPGRAVARSGDPRPAPAEPGPARRSGPLPVETHGSRWPQATGRVRPIRLVVDGLAQGPDGTREPVPGTRTPHETDRCPE
ncbi:DUF6578 domain-containing protein [Streptomyces glaucescens]|uniref:DUF6578 domain-containing protein n=1 Tax=Streptomyces glaucescens TaxID=1907 RepID=UPI00344DA504